MTQSVTGRLDGLFHRPDTVIAMPLSRRLFAVIPIASVLWLGATAQVVTAQAPPPTQSPLPPTGTPPPPPPAYSYPPTYTPPPGTTYTAQPAPPPPSSAYPGYSGTPFPYSPNPYQSGSTLPAPPPNNPCPACPVINSSSYPAPLQTPPLDWTPPSQCADPAACPMPSFGVFAGMAPPPGFSYPSPGSIPTYTPPPGFSPPAWYSPGATPPPFPHAWSAPSQANGPMLMAVSSETGVSGQVVELTLGGQGFVSGAQLFLNDSAQSTQFINANQLVATVVLPTVDHPDVLALSVTNPNRSRSNAVPFMVAPQGSDPKANFNVGKNIDISAPSVNVKVSSDSPVTAMVCQYAKNPSSADINSSSFTDVFVKDASSNSQATVYFTVPAGLSNPELQFWDTASKQWKHVVSGGSASNNNGELAFVASSSSSPKITDLGGTYFALVRSGGTSSPVSPIVPVIGIGLLGLAVAFRSKLGFSKSQAF